MWTRIHCTLFAERRNLILGNPVSPNTYGTSRTIHKTLLPFTGRLSQSTQINQRLTLCSDTVNVADMRKRKKKAVITIRFIRVAAKKRKALFYRECRLDGVRLLGGYEIQSTRHSKRVLITNRDDLHQAIGLHLATQKKMLSGKELRFLRKHMALTQVGLGNVLGIGWQQLGRYEQGKNKIVGPVILLVRALFIQSVGGEVNIRGLSMALADSGAPGKRELVFDYTAQGWRAITAA